MRISAIFVFIFTFGCSVFAWQPQEFRAEDLTAADPRLLDALAYDGVIQVQTDNVNIDNGELLAEINRCIETSPRVFPTVETSHGERFTIAAKSGDSGFPVCAPTAEHLRHSVLDFVGKSFSAGFLPEVASNSATFLDHYHLYTVEKSVPAEEPLVPLHIDRGLFLVITPAEGLVVERTGEDGRLVEVLVETKPNHVLILVGGGLARFQSNFKPCMHGVGRVAAPRAVLARMYLLSNEEKRGESSGEGGRWRRLTEQQCKADEKMCWHQCMKVEGCEVDDSVCWDRKKEVFCNPNQHNTNCGLVCPALMATSGSTEDEFCFGGTSMFMDGFQWCLAGGQPCVILFTERFKLDSKLKFIFGCLAVFLLGACVEGIVVTRKKVVGQDRRRIGKSKKALASVLFGTNLTVAYLIMLVAMTYSIELFFSVIFGLVVGHLVWKNEKDAALYESPEPCCITAPNSTQVTASLAHNCQCG